jgi:mannosyltransferase
MRSRPVDSDPSHVIQAPDPPHAGSWNALSLALLAAIVALVVVSRVWQARESLWIDELHTAWCAVGPWSEVASRAAEGNQSPLYFRLVWLLVQTLGASELVLRLPSLVAGALLPVALYFVTRRWTGSVWLGLLPAWLAAVGTQAIFFGTEARPYALVQLLAVLHVAVFAELVDRPTAGRRVLWVGGALLLFYLHYTAILLVAAEFVYYVALGRVRRQPLAYGWSLLVLDGVVVGLLALGASDNLRAIFGRRKNWDFVAQLPLWQAIGLLHWGWAALVVATAAAIGRLLAASQKRDSEGDVKVPDTSTSNRAFETQMLALSWFLVPVLLAWLTTMTDTARILFPRYLAASGPAALVLVALAVQAAPWRSLRVVLGIGLALVALRMSYIPETILARGQLISSRRDDWRSAIAHFNAADGHERDLVLVRTWLIEADGLRTRRDPRLADYCLYPVTSLYPLDAPKERLIPLPRSNSGQLTSATQQQLRGEQRVWLILGGRADASEVIERQLLRSLEALTPNRGKAKGESWRIAARETFGTVRVLRLVRAPGEPK